MGKITVRGSKFAKIGLQEMIDYVGLKGKTVVEIGSYVGDSSEVFAKNCEKVICVDPWQNGYDPSDQSSYLHPMAIIEAQFDSMRKSYPNIEKKKMISKEASELFGNESLYAVYIDGLHTFKGVEEDITLWLPKIIKGGWLCGHDYQARFQGVIDIVNKLFGKPEQVFKDTSWCVRVK